MAYRHRLYCYYTLLLCLIAFHINFACFPDRNVFFPPPMIKILDWMYVETKQHTVFIKHNWHMWRAVLLAQRRECS